MPSQAASWIVPVVRGPLGSGTACAGGALASRQVPEDERIAPRRRGSPRRRPPATAQGGGGRRRGRGRGRLSDRHTSISVTVVRFSRCLSRAPRSPPPPPRSPSAWALQPASAVSEHLLTMPPRAIGHWAPSMSLARSPPLPARLSSALLLLLLLPLLLPLLPGPAAATASECPQTAAAGSASAPCAHCRAVVDAQRACDGAAATPPPSSCLVRDAVGAAAAYVAHFREWRASPELQQQQPDAAVFVCETRANVCCPRGHGGPACEPCPGYVAAEPHGHACSGHGVCNGDGERTYGAPLSCRCHELYAKPDCGTCDPQLAFRHSHTEPLPMLDGEDVDPRRPQYVADVPAGIDWSCVHCHSACDGCTGPGPRDCVRCRWGYFWSSLLAKCHRACRRRGDAAPVSRTRRRPQTAIRPAMNAPGRAATPASGAVAAATGRAAGSTCTWCRTARVRRPPRLAADAAMRASY